MTHDAAAVVLGLEMRIGEANENLLHLVLAKEIGQVPHTVRSVQSKTNNKMNQTWLVS